MQGFLTIAGKRNPGKQAREALTTGQLPMGLSHAGTPHAHGIRFPLSLSLSHSSLDRRRRPAKVVQSRRSGDEMMMQLAPRRVALKTRSLLRQFYL